jgi:hypothetical protein
LSISQGIASYPSVDASAHHDLLKLSEAALVEAKALGGGAIRAHQPPVSQITYTEPGERLAS